MADIKSLATVHNELQQKQISAVAQKKGYDISVETRKTYDISLRCSLLISSDDKPLVIKWISYETKTGVQLYSDYNKITS